MTGGYGDRVTGYGDSALYFPAAVAWRSLGLGPRLRAWRRRRVLASSGYGDSFQGYGDTRVTVTVGYGDSGLRVGYGDSALYSPWATVTVHFTPRVTRVTAGYGYGGLR